MNRKNAFFILILTSLGLMQMWFLHGMDIEYYTNNFTFNHFFDRSLILALITNIAMVLITISHIQFNEVLKK